MGGLGKRAFAIVLALPLAGCAAQMLQGAQNECAAFGYQQGSDAYVDCVRQRYSARQANMQNTLSNMGRQMSAAPDSSPVSSGFVGYLKSQYVSGTSRICSYDKGGSPYVMTIGVADVCPISVP